MDGSSLTQPRLENPLRYSEFASNIRTWKGVERDRIFHVRGAETQLHVPTAPRDSLQVPLPGLAFGQWQHHARIPERSW